MSGLTYFLRVRRGEAEQAHISDEHTAADRDKALYVLRGCVLIIEHPYQASPFSGAGNCWCGRDEHHNLHDVTIIEVDPGRPVQPDTERSET